MSLFCPADYSPLAPGLEREYEDEGMRNRTERVTGIEAGKGLFISENLEAGIADYWSSDAEAMKVHKTYLRMNLMWICYDPPITKFPPTVELGVEYQDTCSVVFPDLPGVMKRFYRLSAQP